MVHEKHLENYTVIYYKEVLMWLEEKLSEK